MINNFIRGGGIFWHKVKILTQVPIIILLLAKAFCSVVTSVLDWTLKMIVRILFLILIIYLFLKFQDVDKSLTRNLDSTTHGTSFALRAGKARVMTSDEMLEIYKKDNELFLKNCIKYSGYSEKMCNGLLKQIVN